MLRPGPRHRHEPRLRVHHVRKRPDPVPGPRRAPELAPYDQIYSERTGVRAPVTRPAPRGTALAVLAGVLDRDGQQRSATQTRNQALDGLIARKNIGMGGSSSCVPRRAARVSNAG